ncbi:MAG: non-ribosomal peptide synthetase [Oscillospiraceae bacterium]|nr:non-ribosomal peptide synthetase [Oscillospiraceae bacterium]
MNREIRYLIKKGCAALEAADGSFAALYFWMFSHGDHILAESSDGYRIHTHTYRQVRERIEQVSAALNARIGAGGQYVALEMENCVEWIVSFWAILRSGNKPYLVNCRHSHALSNGIIKDLKIRYILALKPSALNGETLLFSELKQGGSFEGQFENEIAFSTSATSLNEVVCFYTGAEFTQQLLNVKGIIKASKGIAAHYRGKLKLLAFLPFYHVFGLIAVYFWFTFFGRTLVFLRDYSPDTILKTCRKHEVTHIFAVPMLWHTIEKQLIKTLNGQPKKQEKKFLRGKKFCTGLQNLFPCLGARISRHLMRQVTDQLFGKSVQFCISGGSYIRASAVELFNAIGYPMHNGYGTSEIGITSVELRSRPKYRNLVSVGRPFDSVEYRIGEDGILYVRGSSLCKRKMVNGEMIDIEEWMPTGDCMECIHGDYYIRGRVGDMVLGENGENINPDMIEQHFNCGDALNLCVLGLGKEEDQELSLVAQISPYLSASRCQALIESLYAVNDRLNGADRVQKFYLTTDPLAPPTAVKVGRKYLLRGIENGSIRLRSASEIRKELSVGEEDVCATELYKRIRGIVAKELGRREEDLGPDDHLINDLGVDSLQYFAILSSLAEAFSVSAPSDQERLRYTLREFCQYIERHI